MIPYSLAWFYVTGYICSWQYRRQVKYFALNAWHYFQHVYEQQLERKHMVLSLSSELEPVFSKSRVFHHGEYVEVSAPGKNDEKSAFRNMYYFTVGTGDLKPWDTPGTHCNSVTPYHPSMTPPKSEAEWYSYICPPHLKIIPKITGTVLVSLSIYICFWKLPIIIGNTGFFSP